MYWSSSRFSTLLIISNCSVETLVKDIWAAVEEEILLPIDNNYRLINTLKNDISPSDLEMHFCFSHDRVRQAVYSLIPESEKIEIHLSIGYEMLKSFRNTQRADMIFDMVNHLNYCRTLISDKPDRAELADLNILAGKKAMKSTAFSTALGYYETAKSMLSEEEWAENPEKFFTLSLDQASSALQSGDLYKAESLCGFLLEIAKTNIEKCSVFNVKALLLIFQGKLFETIIELRKALQLLDVFLPESNEEIKSKTQEGVLKLQQFLARTPVEELVNLSVMTDPEKIMAMQLLFQVNPPAIQVNPQLFNLVTLMMFELTVTYGTTPLSCKCFGDCGVILGSMLADYKTGYKLGEAAFALIGKFKAESQKPPVYFVFPFVSFWLKHYKESLDYYDLSYKTGLETGDLMHATYAAAHKIHLLMWVGRNLDECKSETESAMAFIKQVKGASPLLLAEIVHYSIQKLQITPGQDGETDFEAKDKEMTEIIAKTHNIVFLCRFFQYNTFINFILGNIDEAEKWNTMAEEVIFAGQTDFPYNDHYLFKALILVKKWYKVSAEEKIKIKDILADIKEKLKNRAELCPENFAHKYYLLSAEMAIIEDSSLDIIIELFEKTIKSIRGDDFIQLKALCNELYGDFWLKKGNETIGKTYIQEAYYLYKQWGAYRKLAIMDDQNSNSRAISTKKAVSSAASTTESNYLDMVSIFKSTQAISSEIKIEKLLTILIDTLVENAGAQRGCILLINETSGKYYIEAVQDIRFRQSQVIQPAPLAESKDLCLEIVQYVIRTGITLVIHDACSDLAWHDNQYIKNNNIRSVLCLPVLYQNRIKGVVYLENNLSDNVFTSARLETIKILSSQAAISIENARLYETMEEKIRERTRQLNIANEKLVELSLRDSLTGLYNRRYFYNIACKKVSLYLQNYKTPEENGEKTFSPQKIFMGVFLVDIDHFKHVNDTFGHTAGDNVLITISKVLKQMIGKEDFIVRWGGEELLIIMNNQTQEYYREFSKKVIERIGKTPVSVSDTEVIYKTCSLGYTEIPLDASNPELLNLEQIINICDYALYCAKGNGRNCSAHFKLNNQIKESELKKNLIGLSKSKKLNQEYFTIEFT